MKYLKEQIAKNGLFIFLIITMTPMYMFLNYASNADAKINRQKMEKMIYKTMLKAMKDSKLPDGKQTE